MFELVNDAQSGKLGPDAERIAKVGLEWIELMIQKNLDYGSSVWNEAALAPGTEADLLIRIRMSDKISRLKNLFDPRQPGGALVKSETIEDTMQDLGAYCLLWLARPKEKLEDAGEGAAR